MIKLFIVLLMPLLLVLATPGRAAAEACFKPRILIVLDRSSSMITGNSEPGVTKWAAAKSALDTMMQNFQDKAEWGLMTFPGSGNYCSTGQVVVPVGQLNRTTLGTALATPPPSGGSYTPAAQSLRAVPDHSPMTNPQHARYVLFITDGWQWCSLDCNGGAGQQCCQLSESCPCTAGTTADCSSVRGWQADAIKTLKDNYNINTYVLGIGQSNDWSCDYPSLNNAANMGGTALAGCDPSASSPSCYYQVLAIVELNSALNQIALNSTARLCTSGCGTTGKEYCLEGQWANCDAPTTRSCGTACGTSGQESCVNGQWVNCDAPTTRSCSTACGTSGQESCVNGQWANCDAPTTRACQGACGSGTESCVNGNWVNCTAPGQNACGNCGPLPAEACDGLDNNCNGAIDDGASCAGADRCICGSCAYPCESSECVRGGRCIDGYCVKDNCPPGMVCDGAQCVDADGGMLDGGTEPPADGGPAMPDGGPAADGGALTDGGAASDGGLQTDGGTGIPGSPSGCGCRVEGGQAGGSAGLLLFLAILLAIPIRRSRAKH